MTIQTIQPQAQQQPEAGMLSMAAGNAPAAAPSPSPSPAPSAPANQSGNAGMLSAWYDDYMRSMGPGGPQPATFTAAQAGASSWNVDDNQLVRNQIDKVIAKGGPLRERAETRGRQKAQAAGLLNSSIGVQAAEGALYDAAMPIASQDAGTYAQAARTNAELGTQVSIANAGFTNQAGMFNAGARNDLTRLALTEGGQDRRLQAQQNFTAAQADLERAQQLVLADKSIEAQRLLQEAQQRFTGAQNELDRVQQTTMQQSEQGFRAGEAALQRSFQTGERVSQNDFAAVQSALDRQQQLRVQQLQEQGMDSRQATQIAAQERAQRSDQVFTAEQKARDQQFSSSERQAIQAFETSRLQVQNDFTARMQQLQESGMDARQAKQLAMQEALTRMGEAGVQNRFDAQQALQSSQFSFEQNAIDRRMILQSEQRLREMGFQAELNNRNVPTAFAANVSAATMTAVNAIVADGNLTPEAKQAAIQNVIDNGNATLRWASTTYNTAYPPIPGFANSGPLAGPPAPGSTPPPASQGAVFGPGQGDDGTGGGGA